MLFFFTFFKWIILFIIFQSDEVSRLLSEVDSSRTHFQVLGLGLEVSSPRKLPCPRLEDSTIFLMVKILKIGWKFFFYTVFFGDCLKKNFADLEKNFCRSFFAENICVCVLGRWPRAFLSLASRMSVLVKAVLGLGLGFFLRPWPWPRASCLRLHLCLLSFTKF